MQVLNPEFNNRSLSMLTFWSMHTYLKDIEDSYCNRESGHGYIIGVLKQDIGQANANTLVQLSNKEDTIAISIKKPEEDENYNWKKIWKFRVIHKQPEISSSCLYSSSNFNI